MARVTLQTIANAVGVSRMTVSNAFSRPDQLSADLRDRILAVADELGYVGPDPAARALARGSTGTVGIMYSASLQYVFSDEVASEFVGAIADGLAGSGLSLTLLSTEEKGGRVPARDVPMDATLVFSSNPSEPALAWLRKRGLPLVFVDQAPIAGVASVNIDDRGGARAAAQHLVDLGHRRVGIVTVGLVGPFGAAGPAREPEAAESYVSSRRLLGWLDALGAAGVEPVIVQQPKVPYRPETDGYAALGLLLDADPGITGVVCFSDTLAHGVLTAAHDRGLSVPQDLSIVGFDDSPLAASLRPTLTSVRQDVAEKGHLAAAALVAAVQGATGEGDRHDVLPTELVVRESTAPPGPRAGHRRRRTKRG